MTADVSLDDVHALIRELLIEEFDTEPEAIKPEATLEELDLDSLDLVEIAQVVEQRWAVRIRAEDAEGLTTLGEVAEMIHGKVREGATA